MPCSHAIAGSLFMYMWAGLNRFEPSTDLELDSVRIGMGCMSLVTVGKSDIYNYIQNKDIGRKELLYDKNKNKKRAILDM